MLLKSIDLQVAGMFPYLVMFAALYLFLPGLFFGMVFIMLDFLFSYLATRNIELGADLMTIGMVIIAYSYNYIFALMMVPFILFNRVTMGNLKIKHFVKTGIAILIILGTSASKEYPLFAVCMVAITLRYILEAIVFQLIEPSLKQNLLRAYHLCMSYVVICTLFWLIA